MIPADLWEQVRDAIWEGRWLLLESMWNAGLQHPWVFAVLGLVLALKGPRALASAARWIGGTVWHHARDYRTPTAAPFRRRRSHVASANPKRKETNHG